MQAPLGMGEFLIIQNVLVFFPGKIGEQKGSLTRHPATNGIFFRNSNLFKLRFEGKIPFYLHSISHLTNLHIEQRS